MKNIGAPLDNILWTLYSASSENAKLTVVTCEKIVFCMCLPIPSYRQGVTQDQFWAEFNSCLNFWDEAC